MRNRGSTVIIEKNKVALIKRVVTDSVYYVFPGGGMEDGETPEETTIRESFEELGILIKIKSLLDTVDYNGMQYFYHADIVEGVFGTGQGEEFHQSASEKGTYEPIWVDIKTLDTIDVKPREVALKIHDIFK